MSGILRLGEVEFALERNVTVEEAVVTTPDTLLSEDGTLSKIGSTLSKLFGKESIRVEALVHM